MADFKVTATNHTGFTVADLDKTVAYFEEVLGYEVLSKAPRAIKNQQRVTGVPGADVRVAYILKAGHVLELQEYRGPEGRDHVRPRIVDVGSAHIAVDVDDLDAAVAASEPHGVIPFGEIITVDQGPNTGNRIVYVRFPDDGMVVEFIQQAAR